MRRVVPALALVLLAAVLAPPAGAAPPAPPRPVTIGSGWELAADPSDQGREAGRTTGGGDGWPPPTVPGVLEAKPLDEAFGGTVGWYRVRFTGPTAPAGYG